MRFIGVGAFTTTDLARKYVNEVLDSGRLSYGKFTRELEEKFAHAHSCSHGVMTSSGTSALLVALAALKSRYDWSDGDEVIVPAITFVATANVVVQLNLKPVFADVDPDFYSIDPTEIRKKITARTRCIIPAHLFGCPCDMDPILDIAKEYGLKIIEDSCETMFTHYNGRSVGSFGEISCFSTYMAHLLTTGVGGFCLTSDSSLELQFRSLINHGRDPIYLNIDDSKNKTPAELDAIAARRFSFVQMGYSARITEMEGALGLAGFAEREGMLQKRRDNAAELSRRLALFTEHVQLPKIRAGSGHGFMVFPVVLKKETKRKLVNLLERRGIETRDMLPLVNQPLYQKLYNIRESDFPVAEWINGNGFYFGCHQELGPDGLNQIVDAFGEYFA
jgi:perosamine synthetase